MPEGNGDELTRALHKNPLTASIVVAIHSQFPNVVKKALSAGAIELIGKDDPQDLFLMRVAALRTMVEAQTYQRNIEQLLNENKSDDHPVKILLVDDSPTVRAVYGAHLRNGGFEVFEAGSIHEGEMAAHQKLPDMMLVDFILPDGHGDELVRKLLSQIDTSNIMMVMFSNKEDLEDAALGAGAIDIISKDDPDEIFMRRINSMRRYVVSQRKQRQLMLENQEEVKRLLVEAELARNLADEANSSKDNFLASMSHELRTPLTSIIGNSEYLLGQDEPTDLKAVLRDIESAGRAQLALVNDILDMSKISSGKFTIDEAPYNLKVLLTDVENMLSVRAKDTGNQLLVSQKREQQTYLKGDAQRISQILINLLSNAIKFTSNGKVMLTTWNDSSYLFLEVRDTGIGMPAETVERLFKPFEQADSSISKRFGGTGLGLFISHNLAELMGGEIQVTSCEGEGSTFTLRLPYIVTAKTITQEDREESASHSELNAKLSGSILVAEDTIELQLLERRILESMGLTVRVANNGLEAVELAQSETFDLILMDMQMPEMDGIEATRLLRQQGNTAPIVPLTANVMQKHRKIFEDLGCDDFLGKPIDKQELSVVLHKYLREPGLVQIDEVDDELMAIFFESASKNREKITNALSQQDWKQLKEIAHTVKGSAASFGYPELSNLAATVQTAFDDKDIKLAEKLSIDLGNEIAKLLP
ncbi:MAG: response regulator [Gammaproteobacteria bacterium]|jgi:signal transduction histidine kinase|nr:response regulator [Gammaproteobacteria bacterium]